VLDRQLPSVVVRRHHVVSLACLVAVLGACGDGEEVAVEATPAAIASAGTATLDTGTARVAVEVTVAGANGDPVTVEGDGVVDFEHARSELTIDLSALAGGLAGLGEAMPAMAESYFDRPMRSVQDGAVAYACAEFFTMVLGSECLRVDVGATTGLGAAGAGLASPGGADATSLLRLLGGTEAVEELGTETLFGAETTHYRGTITTERALAELPDDAAEALRGALDRLGIDDATLARGVDVWIDADGLVRRIRQESAAPGGQDGSLVTVVSFERFGVDATVDIPDDAVDAGDLIGQFGRLPD
jgi:hypothetical protein